MTDLRQQMREFGLEEELDDADEEAMSDALKANLQAVELIARLRERLEQSETLRRVCKETVVNTVGGIVDGAPTHTGNYLQRLRELVETENEHKKCGPPVDSDLLRIAIPQWDLAIERAEKAEALLLDLVHAVEELADENLPVLLRIVRPAREFLKRRG